MGDLVTFRGSIFVDVYYRAIASTHKRAYFVGLILTVHESTVKTAKLDPSKIFRYTIVQDKSRIIPKALSSSFSRLI